MADNKGYIKIYRSLFDNPVVCKDTDHLAVWIYLLCEATHMDRAVMFGGEKIILKPGQFTTGRKRIASKLNVNISKVQRILKLFENEQQIEQRTDRQCRLISIVNWSLYQESEQRNEQRVNNDRTTSEQRVNTKQECKERKECKNDKNIYAELPPALVATLNDFEEMRKKKRNPMTDRARELLLKKLKTLTGGDTNKCIALLEESIEKGWASVYPPRQELTKAKMKNFMDIDLSEVTHDTRRSKSDDAKDSDPLLEIL